MKGFLFGVFLSMWTVLWIFMPWFLHGDCAMRWTESCTDAEKLAHANRLHAFLIKDLTSK